MAQQDIVTRTDGPSHEAKVRALRLLIKFAERHAAEKQAKEDAA